jgi:hypothetical protein
MESITSVNNNEVINYMEGISYKPISPLIELSLIACSYFLGEPTYYNEDIDNKDVNPNNNNNEKMSQKYILLNYDKNKSRNKIFLDACNNALNYDFSKVLEFAVKCRTEFYMRKSPAQILAIAALHPDRQEFNQKNPMFFRNAVKNCCNIPSDMTSIHQAWMSLTNSIKSDKRPGYPSFLKRSCEDKLKSTTSYQLEKYRKDNIDMVRICHPNKKSLQNNSNLNGGENRDISSLMKNGKLKLADNEMKWESLRSQGLSWIEILERLEWKMPHMAALRNVRNFAFSDPGIENMNKYLEMLLAGVEGGKQFPFQYITAYKNFKSYSNNVNQNKPTYYKRKKSKQIVPQIKEIKSIYKDIIIPCLEECLQKSMKCFPSLTGDVISLSDNSGSAHGTFTSKYGTVKISDIDNLSALFTAYNCTGKGVVGIFGDEYHPYIVDKNRPLLEQYDEIIEIGKTIGQGTENGVWLFFKNAFNDPTNHKFDYWFCYSDMQVGHGELYGDDSDIKNEFHFQKNKSIYTSNCKYINIHECLNKYRKEINSKINTFMVQTAGYNNAILPELIYRGSILSGWTGNEVLYAKKYSELWNEIDA